jgi:hypothetical protein
MSEDSVKATKTQTKFENGKLTFKTGYVFDATSLFPTFAEMNDGQKYVVVYGLKQCGQDFTATEPGDGWTKVTWQAHKLDKLAKGESPSTRKAAATKTVFDAGTEAMIAAMVSGKMPANLDFATWLPEVQKAIIMAEVTKRLQALLPTDEDPTVE